MFDKAVVDTDRFMDLPLSTKALYFLLGMEADDHGFVSHKKVLRIHGGNEDDVKILIAKNFLILFESGVVVITDWHKNNYLDKKRIKDTEYKEEIQYLSIENDKYIRHETPCLTDVKQMFNQYRVEESSIEENNNTIGLPEWLNKEVWDQWIKYRKEVKKPLKPSTIALQIKNLSKYQEIHKEVILKSIEKGWQGLFPESYSEEKSKKVEQIRKVDRLIK